MNAKARESGSGASRVLRLTSLLLALALTAALFACDGSYELNAGRDPAKSCAQQVPAILPSAHGPAPPDFRIDTLSEGGIGEPASILVMISPARAALATGQKIALTATTDDRFGVTWSVSPPAGAITPSSSYNQTTVIFTAPQKPGIYTATATSMTNPGQSSSAIIAVTNLPGAQARLTQLVPPGCTKSGPLHRAGRSR